MPYVPLRENLRCVVCKTTSSVIWRRKRDRKIACNICFLKIKEKELKSHSQNGKGKDGRGGSRSSKRKKGKAGQGGSKGQATKGKNRRIIFKKNPTKAAMSSATVITGRGLFYEGTYIQVGDIVSLMDHDLQIYYAQIRGLLQDEYCNKSAVLTWLLPTQSSRPDKFDPATYILGPEEENPRSLEYLEFVCHAPDDYFKARYAPFPVAPVREDTGFLWTSLTKADAPSVREVFTGKR